MSDGGAVEADGNLEVSVEEGDQTGQEDARQALRRGRAARPGRVLAAGRCTGRRSRLSTWPPNSESCATGWRGWWPASPTSITR